MKKYIVLGVLIGLVAVAGMVTAASVIDPQLVAFVSAKAYYQTGGELWINPFTLQVDKWVW
jgi:hypothetical protein